MDMRYALIDQRPAVDVYVGRILSMHRSLTDAAKNEQTLHRAIERVHGDSSYVPTIIVRLSGRATPGELLERSRIAETCAPGKFRR